MSYGLYIHIPFCHSRCRYCDFYTTAASRAVPEGYISALIRDFARFAPPGQSPATVYFGGGTPSLLTPAQTARLLDAVRPAADAEITLEANPESVTAENLAGWRAAGVNRLSLGVQTARDESLVQLGRLHTRADAQRALALAGDAGFANISADVMLALPGYTTDELEDTLSLLHAGGASHISAYMLKIEPGTPFGKNPPPGLPGEDEAADHYLHAVAWLEKAGYAQYEISNFARPGFESRHNLLYWQLAEWLGLGPAAHSHLGGRRFSFPADVAAYTAASPQPVPQGEVDKNDAIMLALRLVDGLDEKQLAARFGSGLSPRQQAFMQRMAGAHLARPTQGGWALTPAGMLVQNAILSEILESDSR